MNRFLISRKQLGNAGSQESSSVLFENDVIGYWSCPSIGLVPFLTTPRAYEGGGKLRR